MPVTSVAGMRGYLRPNNLLKGDVMERKECVEDEGLHWAHHKGLDLLATYTDANLGEKRQVIIKEISQGPSEPTTCFVVDVDGNEFYTLMANLEVC